ncbi:hypothetical protein [Enterobacter kobei]|nr:hypothetical protein AE42_01649 [Enterobacter kobei]
MDLQTWDNVISIVSNAVTALSVVGGVVFGGVKLQEMVKTRKMERVIDSAIALKEKFDNLFDFNKVHKKSGINPALMFSVFIVAVC